jgi:acyl-CoA synthetase (AMP-forming)/AMP-acid ligase II
MLFYTPDPEGLRAQLRDVLARTATGKLQKFKLREPYWAGRTRRVN